ncbi:MAG: sialate O-acetylesterase [bacterium]|nr:sialate O-acetylesterase [bacterium]
MGPVAQTAMLALVCTLLAASSACGEDHVTRFVSPSARLRVFVLAGQSNMVGSRCQTAQLPLDLQGDQRRALFFNGVDWVRLAPGVTEEEGFGPEISFAHTGSAEMQSPVGIIKHSVGGTDLAHRWNPDDPRSLYGELLKKVRAAQASRPIQVVGMLWMQGERDSKDEAMASAYADNLARLIHSARRDFDAPDMVFVAGRVNPPKLTFPFVDHVRTAQKTCPVEGYGFIDCDDLPKGSDNLHYSTHGVVEMGRRFAGAVVKLGEAEKQEY